MQAPVGYVNLTIFNRTRTCLYLKWTHLDAMERNGYLTGYEIAVSGYDNKTRIGVVTEHKICNLNKGYRYGVTIRASNKYGLGPSTTRYAYTIDDSKFLH